VAANTSGIPEGGVAKDFTVWKSFLEILFNDSLAFSTKGMAASRSFSVDSFLAWTSFLITAHLSASTLAF
jgi:hypothetical protein